ncbi:hypothetical protein ACFLY9_02655 [Patescibacteria group bacterium]
MAEKIFVDLDEEILFVAEKVKNSMGDKVILVVPERASLLGSSVSLKILYSEITKLDKLAVLVTKDEIGLRLAKGANFVAAEKVSDINGKTWEEVKSSKEKYLDKREVVKEKLVEDRKERPSQPEDFTPKEIEKPISDVEPIKPKKVDIGGFEMVVGGDIAKLEQTIDKSISNKQDQDMQKETSSAQKDELSGSKKGLTGRDLSSFSYTAAAATDTGKKKKKLKSDGPGIGDKVGGVFEKIKEFFKKGGNRPKILIGLGVILVVFFIVSYFVLPTGKVVVKVESEDIEFEKDVIADTAVTVLDTETLTIPAKLIESVKDTSETADATGTKETGEQASGQVTIYNKTESEVTVQSGTVLESIESGLKYTTTSAITIDAKRPDDDPEYPGMYGVADVGIAAESFGEDYNTSDKEEFRISGFDVGNLYGKNFNSITGGTTEEKKVVSQEDFDGLKESLEEQLKADLLESLKTEAGSSRELLEDTIEYEVINENASPGVDAEATTFSLSITIKATALSFLKEDIDSLAEVLVEEENEENVEVEEFEYSSKVLNTEGNKININLSITGVVTPSVNQDELKSNLSGKGKGAAESYLTSQEQIKSYEITLTPSWLPSFLKHFPSSIGKIEVEIQKE